MRSPARALNCISACSHTLNPIVRGWAAYYRTGVSSEAFSALDRYLWQLTYKWAKFGHPNKSKHWVINRYFGAFNKFRQDRWVFGDRVSGAYRTKFAWTGIVRHRMVKGGSSPDDPALAHYWADRRRRGAPPPLDPLSLRLLKTQAGMCPSCGDLLLHADHPHRKPPPNGSSGFASPARRCASSTSSTRSDAVCRTTQSVSYTPTVSGALSPRP